MQSFIVVASLVSELAGGGGQNDPLVLNITKKHLSPLRVKLEVAMIKWVISKQIRHYI